MQRSSRWMAIALLSLLTSACQRSRSAPAPSLPPLPQDPQIQVYFNQAEHQSYQQPVISATSSADDAMQRPGDDLEAVLTEAIASASQTLDIAVQELRLPGLAQAIVQRHQAGVQARVILEHQYNQTWTEWSAQAQQLKGRDRQRYNGYHSFIDTNADGQVSPQEIAQGDAVALLRQAGVPIIDDRADGSKGSGLMHHKFAVIDRQTVVTGSANWTPSGIHQEPGEPESRGNVNHLLRLESAALARSFTKEFELMWGDGPGHKTNSRFGVKKPVRSPQRFTLGASSVLVTFSPTGKRQPWQQSSNGLIAQTVAQAQKSVDLALFVFSEQKIADALGNGRDRGVEVRALIDPGFAFRDYSEGLDMLGIALKRKDCRVEQDNRPWSPALSTVGVPQLPTGDSLHHKFAVLDGQAVITGSHNWSKAANEKNDETLLVIENPTVAAHFQREFDRLYRDAVLGIPVAVQQKLKQQKTRCTS